MFLKKGVAFDNWVIICPVYIYYNYKFRLILCVYVCFNMETTYSYINLPENRAKRYHNCKLQAKKDICQSTKLNFL